MCGVVKRVACAVKATTPLWTALLARALTGERQTRGVQAALVLIAGGVALASATELHFDAVGLGAALAAAALLALQHIYSKRVMRDTGVHHLRLLQVTLFITHNNCNLISVLTCCSLTKLKGGFFKCH